MLKALEEANDQQEGELRRWMSTNAQNAAEKVQAVTAIFEDLHVKEAASQLMDQYYDKAIAALNRINVSDEKKAYFKGFADQLMKRTY